MARNKYPEITENLILETSMKLFIEKGYEQTTLQDIADAMGMTRGAIYHHFKNKEQMVDVVMTYMFHKAVPFQKIRGNEEFSALEKIRQIIAESVASDDQIDLYIPLSKTFVDNPKLAAAYMEFTKNNVVEMFYELIREGIEDGTIQAKNPRIIAELLAVMINFWIAPMLFLDTKENFAAKLKYAADILNRVGLPVIDEKLENAFEKIVSALPER